MRALDVEAKDYKTVVPNLVTCMAVDVLVRERTVFWSDEGRGAIAKVDLKRYVVLHFLDVLFHITFSFKFFLLVFIDDTIKRYIKALGLHQACMSSYGVLPRLTNQGFITLITWERGCRCFLRND